MKTGFSSKKTLIIVAVIIAALVGLQIYSLSLSPKQNQQDIADVGNARLVLDWGNGSRRMFEGNTIAGMSIWHALIQSAKAGNFEVDYEGDDGTIKVEKIAGVGEPEGKWFFLLNGQEVNPQEIALEPIKEGDVIEIKLATQ